MRLSRAKQMRKHLRFYRIVYGIAPPYAVLLDGNFIHMALKVKMDILDRLKKLLLGEDFKCFVPRAVLDELRALGPATAVSLQWAEACCEVLDYPPSASATDDDDNIGGDAPVTAMSAGDAIRALVGARNEGRYMVATQDQELRADMRHVPSVALLFVARAVLLMEPPSDASRQQSAAVEKTKVRRLDEEGRALVEAVKGKGKETATGRASGGPGQGQGQGQPPKVRLKKKARGPNPLSVKKAKRPAKGGSKGGRGEQGEGNHEGDGEKKRKRKHKKHKKGEAAAAAGGD